MSSAGNGKRTVTSGRTVEGEVARGILGTGSGSGSGNKYGLCV